MYSVLTITEEFSISQILQVFNPYCTYFNPIVATQYPLPLISDLLDAPKKARIYMKIDLQHAYHLV